MSDEAGKATDRLEQALDPDKRGGWTRLMDGDDGVSELDALRSVIADAREVESLREQLAARDATIAKLREWITKRFGDAVVAYLFDAAPESARSESRAWQPGDPCNGCGSSDTIINDDGWAECRSCRRTDADT